MSDARRPEAEKDEAAGRAVSRRGVLTGAAAGVATLAGSSALQSIQAAADEGPGFEPRLLDAHQARTLEVLCDLLLPRTSTPSAGDAGVPEYIDLALSLADSSDQLAFLGGLDWIDRRCERMHGHPFLEATAEQHNAMLEEISDGRADHPAELRAGAAFFRDLKRRTLFGYYTSKAGRVEALGRPAEVRRETLEGCGHDGSDHSA